MKRDDLVREFRKLARIHFAVIPGRGKGSHYRVEFGDRWTTVQSGELTPEMVRRIKRQLGMV
jgi:hypothetical protein